MATALAAVGGSDDVAKLTLYVVDWSGDKMTALGEGFKRAAARFGVDPVKPITAFPVTALGEPDLPAEVDATAVLMSTTSRTPTRPDSAAPAGR